MFKKALFFTFLIWNSMYSMQDDQLRATLKKFLEIELPCAQLDALRDDPTPQIMQQLKDIEMAVSQHKASKLMIKNFKRFLKDKKVSEKIINETYVDKKNKISHFLAKHGIFVLFQYLTENYHMDILQQRNDGKTPWMLANTYGHTKIANFIEFRFTNIEHESPQKKRKCY